MKLLLSSIEREGIFAVTDLTRAYANTLLDIHAELRQRPQALGPPSWSTVITDLTRPRWFDAPEGYTLELPLLRVATSSLSAVWEEPAYRGLPHISCWCQEQDCQIRMDLEYLQWRTRLVDHGCKPFTVKVELTLIEHIAGIVHEATSR